MRVWWTRLVWPCCSVWLFGPTLSYDVISCQLLRRLYVSYCRVNLLQTRMCEMSFDWFPDVIYFSTVLEKKSQNLYRIKVENLLCQLKKILSEKPNRKNLWKRWYENLHVSKVNLLSPSWMNELINNESLSAISYFLKITPGPYIEQ